MNQSDATRSIAYGDHILTIHGSVGDSYFENINLDDHANDMLAGALRGLRADAVVLDVGANIGLTAIMAAHHAALVYAFEPSPNTFALLTRSAAANATPGEIKPVNLAIGAAPGELNFFQDPSSSSASHAITGGTLGRRSTLNVPVTTVDLFAAKHGLDRVDFIKIDIEGFETDALAGAVETIGLFQPSALIEYNAFTMVGFRNMNPRDLLTQIRSLFPYVYRWRNGPVLIGSDLDALGFIHDNLVSAGSVEDLYGRFSPL